MHYKKRIQQESEFLNNATYIDYYTRIKEMAINAFEWINLPVTCDERFLELCCFEQGLSLFFKDEVMDKFLNMRGVLSGELDIYNIPIRRDAYASNGYFNSLTADNSVIIFNNYLHTPTEMTVRLYAKRLYQVQRIIDVNINNQRNPVVIVTTENQKMSAINSWMNYDGNQPVIIIDEAFENSNQYKVLNANAPYNIDKLNDYKNQIWNEALAFCGIEAIGNDKKERQLVNEVQSNFGRIEAQRNVMLNARKQACKEINAMWGLDVDVRFRTDRQLLAGDESLLEGDVENVDVYNTSSLDNRAGNGRQ